MHAKREEEIDPGAILARRPTLLIALARNTAIDIRE